MKPIKLLLRQYRVLIVAVVFMALILVSVFSPLFQGLSTLFSVSQNNAFQSKLSRSILGTTAEPKTTLLLLANNNAIRVGGGFVGTVAVLKGDGKSVQIEEVRSVYFYDHRLEQKGGFLSAPEYMSGFTGSLRIGDSLYTPLSRQNLQLAGDIFSRESGRKIDNVVEITPNTIKDFLAIIGPVELPEYSMTITAENFLQTLQLEVESGEDRVVPGKDPKTVIGVLADALLKRLPNASLGQTQQLYELYHRAADGDGLRALLDIHGAHDRGTLVTNSKEELIGAQNSVLITTANLDAGKGSSLVQQENDLSYSLRQDGTEQLQVKVGRTNTASEKLSYIDPRTGGGNDIIGTDVAAISLYLSKAAVMNRDGQFNVQASDHALLGVYNTVMNLGLKEGKQVQATFELPSRGALEDRIIGQKTVLYQFGAYPQRITLRVQAPEGYEASDLPSNARRIDRRTLEFSALQDKDLTFSYQFDRIK